MVTQTIKLGGTAKDVVVGRISHGLMSMTWTPNPVPDEVCFESIKAGIDALPANAKVVLNTGEFYDINWGTGNLEMLKRFFDKYPEYVDRVFLNVKGGVNFAKRGPDGSLEYLRKSVDNCIRALGPRKKIDLFEPARVDRETGIEKIMENLVILVKEGKFDHIGLSECNADTLRKANAVYPVTSAEIEVSPSEYGEQQKKVIATATELGITIFAYSPIGRGLLTGQIKSTSDISEDDHRKRMTRFKEEHLQNNLALVNEIVAIASKKGVTPAQLCIAWVALLGPTMIPLPGSSKASRTLENLAAGDIVLSEEEKKAIDEAIGKHKITGDRYFGGAEAANLWG